jgi:PEP-CTERM motif
MGTAQGPASGTSTTFSPGGRVQLVVPVRMVSFMAVVPIVATLTIDFVPEPATGVLLGGGIAVLVGAAGRRR